MIGRQELPKRYLDWNVEWGAPNGRALKSMAGRLPLSFKQRARRIGPFGFQPNNLTRRFEYPWAFFAGDVRPGQRIVEVGGALSGFQFALASLGADVRNIDPFLDYGSPAGYADTDPIAMLEQLNAAFGSSVRLFRSTLADAAVATASVDRIFCISTLEHLSGDAIASVLDESRRVLKVGGRFVTTIDLFLDLAPFTTRQSNQWGHNVDVKAIVERSGLSLVEGRKLELHGYPEFDADRVQSDLGLYLIGNYPALAQALVLEKV